MEEYPEILLAVDEALQEAESQEEWTRIEKLRQRSIKILESDKASAGW